MAVFLFALAGSLAQLVDGTLGMGFGITSSTFLVFLGATPVAASAAVHFAELGTTFASGASHWRAGNVDKRVVKWLGSGGALGAFLGATVLSHVSLSSAKTGMAAILLLLGLVLVARFGLDLRLIPQIKGKPRAKFLIPLGVFAGFTDASGGGGWGPVTTPTLLGVSSHAHPRTVVGTVSASEFLVSVFASAGFILGAGTSGIDYRVIAGLLLGGVLMAPFAAMLAGRMPHAPFGALIGGMVVFTNGRTVLLAAGVPDGFIPWFLLVVAVVALAAARTAWNRERTAGVEHSFFEEAVDSPEPRDPRSED